MLHEEVHNLTEEALMLIRKGTLDTIYWGGEHQSRIQGGLVWYGDPCDPRPFICNGEDFCLTCIREKREEEEAMLAADRAYMELENGNIREALWHIPTAVSIESQNARLGICHFTKAEKAMERILELLGEPSVYLKGKLYESIFDYLKRNRENPVLHTIGRFAKYSHKNAIEELARLDEFVSKEWTEFQNSEDYFGDISE